MTTDPGPAQLISVDTSVVRIIAAGRPSDPDYEALVRRAAPVVTFFADAELAAVNWMAEEDLRLARFNLRLRVLGDPGGTTKAEFIKAHAARRRLGLSRRQRDLTDLWIIAQTAEYGLALASHDRQMIRVAAAAGLETITLLPGIERQLAADRRTMIISGGR